MRIDLDNLDKVFSDMYKLCLKKTKDVDVAFECVENAKDKLINAIHKDSIDSGKGTLFSYAHACVNSCVSDYYKQLNTKYLKEYSIEDVFLDSEDYQNYETLNYVCTQDYERDSYEYEMQVENLTLKLQEVIKEIYQKLEKHKDILDILLKTRFKKDKKLKLNNSYKKLETYLYSIIAEKLKEKLNVEVSVENIALYFKELAKVGKDENKK